MRLELKARVTLLRWCTILPNLMEHTLSKIPQTITTSVLANKSSMVSLNCRQTSFFILLGDKIKSKGRGDQ